MIDDFEFTSDELKPYLSSAFGQLFDLLKEVEECDTKLSILNVLSYVIERYVEKNSVKLIYLSISFSQLFFI